MFRIHEDLCTGCGLCKRDCPSKTIRMVDGKASAIPNAFCMACGHCIAICPTGSAWLDELDMSEVIPGTLAETALEPAPLLRAIKGRRSIRRFGTQGVERAKIEQMIEAGRFTPTSGNCQTVSYVVIEKDVKAFTKLAIEGLLHLGEKTLAAADEHTNALTLRYAKLFLYMHKKYTESNGSIDGLFFNAPAVLVLVGNNAVDAGMAASNLELMAYAQGLGLVFSGFLVQAIANDQPLRDYLGIPKGMRALVGLALGYPDVNYLRSVPRRKAVISYK
ncbi:MAG: nitroreductase family protein [Oscillospiraceae bacterium]